MGDSTMNEVMVRMFKLMQFPYEECQETGHECQRTDNRRVRKEVRQDIAAGGKGKDKQ